MQPPPPSATEPSAVPFVVEGGDRACGELLLVLVAHTRRLPPGSLVRLVATDPAAPLDLPAWCHLTGHRYLGRALDVHGRSYYDIETTAGGPVTDEHRPWHLRAEAGRSTSLKHRREALP